MGNGKGGSEVGLMRHGGLGGVGGVLGGLRGNGGSEVDFGVWRAFRKGMRRLWRL